MNADLRAVPQVDLAPQYTELKSEIDEAVLRVLASGSYILGQEVRAFESEMADYIGVAHGVGVASGTEALQLIIRALGIGPGDEVVTSALTFIATADAVAACGATPVFADIDPRTYNMAPDSVRAKLSGRTRAIIAVHLHGQPADLEALGEISESAGVSLLEDCAQSHGARFRGKTVGSFGRASAFSFFPTKPLGGVGDGGMVCCDDSELAESVRMLRAHGSRHKYLSEELGINSRLDEIQAAVLRVKLRRLDAWNEERRRIAAIYNDRLSTVETPYVAGGNEHVYHQYTVRTRARDELKATLAADNVGSNVYYPVPLHLQPCFEGLGYSRGDLPGAERASSETLSLPIFPGMTRQQVERVSEAVNNASRGKC
jgi:UDP-N-acetyl-3-dehydro-alpha-D-glucosamine 3-aminotranferase